MSKGLKGHSRCKKDMAEFPTEFIVGILSVPVGETFRFFRVSYAP